MSIRLRGIKKCTKNSTCESENDYLFKLQFYFIINNVIGRILNGTDKTKPEEK